MVSRYLKLYVLDANTIIFLILKLIVGDNTQEKLEKNWKKITNLINILYGHLVDMDIKLWLGKPGQSFFLLKIIKIII